MELPVRCYAVRLQAHSHCVSTPLRDGAVRRSGPLVLELCVLHLEKRVFRVKYVAHGWLDGSVRAKVRGWVPEGRVGSSGRACICDRVLDLSWAMPETRTHSAGVGHF